MNIRFLWLSSCVFVCLASSASGLPVDAVRATGANPVRICPYESSRGERLCFTPKGPEAGLVVIAPGSVVESAFPTLDWNPVEGAVTYRVSIHDGASEVWRASTTGTQLQYSGAEPLADRTAYRLTLAAFSPAETVMAQVTQVFNVRLFPAAY